MNYTLPFLGIYQDAIESAADSAENALRVAGVSNDDFNDMVIQELEESGDFSDITNSIIHAFFIVAHDLIRQSAPDVDVRYYVNCDDSHIYVNGNEC